MNTFLSYMDVQQQTFSNILNTDLQEDKSKISVNWFNNFVSNAKIIILSKIPDTVQDLIKDFSLNKNITKTTFVKLTHIKEDLFRKGIRHGKKIVPKYDKFRFNK